MNASAAELVDPQAPIAVDLSADPQQLLDWAEDGRALLADAVEKSHAPADRRVMRTYTQTEVLELVGQNMERPLRAWVHQHVAPRHATTSSERRVRLTIEDVYAFMTEHSLLPERARGSKPARLMVGAYKGGSAKSTLTLHLAHYMGTRFWRVLVIDTDPQATLTKHFGLLPELVKDEDTMKPIFAALADGEDIPALKYLPTHFPTIWLTPANLQLMEADISLAVAFQQDRGKAFYTALDQSLSQIEDDFDVILIDTPPAFSFTSVSTIWASTGLILPMPADTPDFAATFDFCEMVGDLFERITNISGTPKVWDPVVVVHSKVKNWAQADNIRRLAGEVFGGNRLEEFIPDMAPVSSSSAQFKSVFEVTGTTVDSRQVARAREYYSALGERLLRVLAGKWEKQASEAKELS